MRGALIGWRADRRGPTAGGRADLSCRPGQHKQRARDAATQRVAGVPGRDTDGRAPDPDTKSAGPDTQSAGPRTQKTPGPDTDSAAQHSAGPDARTIPYLICYCLLPVLYTGEFIFYIKNSHCMSSDAGDSRCHKPWPFFFHGDKEQMIQKASVNGSYNHGLAFASRSVCFSKHACTVEILLVKCW